MDGHANVTEYGMRKEPHQQLNLLRITKQLINYFIFTDQQQASTSSVPAAVEEESQSSLATTITDERLKVIEDKLDTIISMLQPIEKQKQNEN